MVVIGTSNDMFDPYEFHNKRRLQDEDSLKSIDVKDKIEFDTYDFSLIF